jgi:N-acetyltransferase 10
VALGVLPEAPSAKEGEIGTDWKPVEISVEDELNEAGNEATKALRERQWAMIDSLDLSKRVA